MFLLKLIRKFGKLVRGGVSPRQITLGALLGFLIGMMPGFNLSVLLVALLLLVLNAHIGIALMGLALGKLLMYLLAPVTFQIGFALIHNIGLEGLFRALANTPVLALLDLHVYSLIGGLPIAIVVGLIFAWIMNRFVQSLRKGIIEATEHSERMRKLAGNMIVRFFMRIVFGKQKEDIQELLQKHPPLFRKSGLGLAAAVLVIGVVVEFLLLDTLFAVGLKKGLEAANGAEINLAEADLSLAKGRMGLRGLQITDPAKPTHNSFQAKHVSADLSLKNLLRKRYVIDLLAVETVQFNNQRTSPGQVFEKPPEPPPEKEKNKIDYLEKAQTIRGYLAKLQKYLEKINVQQKKEEKREKAHKSILLDTAENRGYLALSAKDFFANQPTWIIRNVKVDGVSVPKLSKPQYIDGRNVSSHPELVSGPMAFKMAAGPDEPSTGALQFNFHDPGALHEFSLSLNELSLDQDGILSEDAPVVIKDGEADVDIQGRFSSKEIDFPFTVGLSRLQAQNREGESVLGMDPETAGEVFKNIDSFKLGGRISGSLSSPRLMIDTGKTVDSLKSALARAGKQRLMGEVDKQVEKTTGKLKEEAGKKIEEQVGGMLGGEKEKEEGSEKDAADKLKDLL
ncbi:MAG: DUF2062 domain-containing protein [Desulfurivibrionaceae bacterium]